MGSLVKRKVQWGPVLLELIPGWLGFFGIGHMVQGRFGMGLFIMLSFWVLAVFNLMLIPFLGLGYVTGFLTWLFYMITSPMNANDYGK